MKAKGVLLVCALLAGLGIASPAAAQRSVADLLGREATPEGQPKQLLEEIMLWGYLENSYVINLSTLSPHNVNDLRFYPHYADHSWSPLELSVKKDPPE